MASIYLVNALYNKEKLSHPADCPPQPTGKIEDPPRHDCKSVDAMHPSRQRIINVLGPLQEEPEPVAYKVSGANTQPVGHKMPPSARSCVKGTASRLNVASGSTIMEIVRERSDTVRSVGAAQLRSLPNAAPSATSIPHSNQHLHLLGGNTLNSVIVERDPRRRASNVDFGEAASCSGSAEVPRTHSSILKQEDTTSDVFSAQSDPRVLASPTDTASPHPRADSLPLPPMVGRDQLHRPVTSSAFMRPGEQSTGFKHSDYDPPYDSEIRIRELEDENIALRKGGFQKDREIRNLKAELLRRGPHIGSFEVGMKRPRYDEGLLLMDDVVREQQSLPSRFC